MNSRSLIVLIFSVDPPRLPDAGVDGWEAGPWLDNDGDAIHVRNTYAPAFSAALGVSDHGQRRHIRLDLPNQCDDDELNLLAIEVLRLDPAAISSDQPFCLVALHFDARTDIWPPDHAARWYASESAELLRKWLPGSHLRRDDPEVTLFLLSAPRFIPRAQVEHQTPDTVAGLYQSLFATKMAAFADPHVAWDPKAIEERCLRIRSIRGGLLDVLIGRRRLIAAADESRHEETFQRTVLVDLALLGASQDVLTRDIETVGARPRRLGHDLVASIRLGRHVAAYKARYEQTHLGSEHPLDTLIGDYRVAHALDQRGLDKYIARATEAAADRAATTKLVAAALGLIVAIFTAVNAFGGFEGWRRLLGAIPAIIALGFALADADSRRIVKRFLRVEAVLRPSELWALARQKLRKFLRFVRGRRAG